MRDALTRWLIVALLLGTAVYALAEDITLTTYYPSPRGVYQELKTAGDLIVGDITNPPAARLHVVQQGTAPALRVDDEAGGDLTPFVVDASGNVGIGTASPGSKLTVIGTIESSADGVKFPDSTVQTTASPWAASATDIYNTNTGNVGIGTVTPAGKLDVAGNVIAAAPAGFTVAGTPPVSFTQDGSGNAQISTSATERLRITAAGNVGIGTATPSASAILEISSANSGIRFPLVNDPDADILAPVQGLVVYDQGDDRLEVYDGTAWVAATLPAGGIDQTLNMGCGACGCLPADSYHCEMTWTGGILTDRQCILDFGCSPPPPPPSTPFLAPWNGQEYVVDNEFLMGYPSSFRPTFEEAKALYERGAFFIGRDNSSLFRFERIAYDRGDLYKLRRPPVAQDGRYRFLILEREPEESFIDELTLLKAVHDPDTELFVATNLSRFYALNTAHLQRPIACRTSRGEDCRSMIDQPTTTADALLLKEKEFAEVTFAYTPLTSPTLLIRAKYKPESANALWAPPPPSRTPWFHPVAGHLVRLLDRLIPSVYGCFTESVRVSYQDHLGRWNLIGIMHPRGNYATEAVELPEAAVRMLNQKQAIALRLLWTSTHAVSFVGLVDEPERPVTLERLSPLRASHHRLHADYAQALSRKNHEYLHTIQGDVVEVEYETGGPIPEGKTATFLVTAEGFYTNLRAYLYPNTDFTYYKQFWKSDTIPQGGDPGSGLSEER